MKVNIGTYVSQTPTVKSTVAVSKWVPGKVFGWSMITFDDLHITIDWDSVEVAQQFVDALTGSITDAISGFQEAQERTEDSQ